ncbi:hypothetical protein GCM10025876_25400 [Demequina litorisediminis]|uniref:DNA 3'-5' helicase n=1 Tax=Demequina litorisediminis TaxID=1849022 RepID=A0ABQ6IFY2_9MICO|nr:hypothetical protein GCM10025876_25400 [Demequina litorisediminis]
MGDADQSIYAFRGATIRNILEFEADYPAAHIVRLEQNYRSTQNILSAANAVIKNNEGRRPKNLWTDSGAGAKIEGYAGESEQDEAQYIAGEIRRLIDAGDYAAGDIAIMYRANAQSRALEERFMRAEIPYKVIGGTRFYDRKEIKDMLAYLSAIVNEDDDIAMRRIINTPRRAIGDTAVEGIDGLRRSLTTPEASVASATPCAARMRRACRRARCVRSAISCLSWTTSAPSLPTTAPPACSTPSRTAPACSPRTAPRMTPRMRAGSRTSWRLVAVGREFTEENPEGTLEDFLEKVALVADADQASRRGRLRGRGHHDDAAHRQGPRVPRGVPHRHGGRHVPAHALHRVRRDQGHGRGAPPRLRGPHPRPREGSTSRARRCAPGGEHPSTLVRLASPRRSRRSLIEWKIAQASMAALRARSDRGTSRAGSWGDSGGYGGNQDRADGNAYSRAGAVTSRYVPPSPPGGGVGGDVGFEVGDRVMSDKFGMGKVVGTEGAGRNAVAKVDFGTEGVKRLVLRFNALEKA